METSTPTAPNSVFRDWQEKHGTSKRSWEKLIEWALLGCGLFSIAVTLAIATVILVGSFDFFTKTDLKEDGPEGRKGEMVWMSGGEIWNRTKTFFTGTRWTESSEEYGILPLLVATMTVTLIAALLAIPIGLLTATYLSEYASARVRAIAKPTLPLNTSPFQRPPS